jgi:hypothetical protein
MIALVSWMIALTIAIALMTAALLLFTYWLWQDAKENKGCGARGWALTISYSDACSHTYSRAQPICANSHPHRYYHTTVQSYQTPAPQTTSAPQAPTTP